MVTTINNEQIGDQISDLIEAIKKPSSLGKPCKPLRLRQLPGYIDHTLLKVEATEQQIDDLCDEARQWKFKVRFRSRESSVLRYSRRQFLWDSGELHIDHMCGTGYMRTGELCGTSSEKVEGV